jgi:hypothetical protein
MPDDARARHVRHAPRCFRNHADGPWIADPPPQLGGRRAHWADMPDDTNGLARQVPTVSGVEASAPESLTVIGSRVVMECPTWSRRLVLAAC